MQLRCLLAIFSLVVVVVPARAQTPWVPPVGIPAPSFGIVETHQNYAGQTFAAGGFVYRDDGYGPHTHVVKPGSGSDTNNPYGRVATPRNTMPPMPLPPGSVLLLLTNIRVPDATTWTMNGTASNPVFMRCVGAPVVDVGAVGWDQGSDMTLAGSYAIVEGCNFLGTTAVGNSSSHHIVFRDNEAREGSAGGVLTSNGTDIVILRNKVHDGHRSPGEVHNIHPGAQANRLWIVDNLLYRPSGDNIQFCHGCATQFGSGPGIVYIGRNTMLGGILPNVGVCAGRSSDCPSENGIDLKGYNGPVIASQNITDGRAPNQYPGGQSQCMRINDEGVTQGPFWSLFNRCIGMKHGLDPSGSTAGENVATGGGSSAGAGGVYSFGDVFWNLSGSAVTGGGTRVENATIYQVGTGISGTYQGADRYTSLRNTIIINASVATTGVGTNDGCEYLLIFGSGANDPQCAANLLTTNPLFVNAAAGDFRLQTGSPAKGTGTTPTIPALFLSMYGRTIPGPVGGGWDRGSYDVGTVTPESPPPDDDPPLPAPTIAGVAPVSGTTLGGTTVTITGTGFRPGAIVAFNGAAATAVITGLTSIAAMTPAHAAGVVDVVVTNTDGTSARINGGFTFTTDAPPPPPPPTNCADMSKYTVTARIVSWTTFSVRVELVFFDGCGVEVNRRTVTVF